MDAGSRSRRAALAGYVPSLRHYDIDGLPAGEHIGLPSTTVTLVVPLGAPLELSTPDVPRHRLSVCLAGLHDRPTTIHLDGVQRGVQLGLSPLHLRKLLGVPAGELSGRAVELADVIGLRDAAELVERLETEPGWPRKRRLVEQMLLRQLDRRERVGDVRPEVARAWAQLVASGGTARIRDVAAGVGWTARHLTDEFRAHVGLAPKTVARVVRFRRSTALVAAGVGPAVVAARSGYSDQAHMTREWRSLAGTTPGRWLRDDVLANVQDSGPSRRESG